MRAAAILGPGDVSKYVEKFRRVGNAEWSEGPPALSNDADVVVIFGGDGTIHHQLPRLVELGIPALIVPCGSGNDFARALGIRNTGDSVAAWKKFAAGGPSRPIDLGVISDSTSSRRFFCCVAGVGIDSAIAQRANALPKWLRARGGYALSAPREFIRFAPLPMRIFSDGTRDQKARPMLLVVAANTPAYGGGMKIAPHALLDDGKLDLCAIEGMNVFKLFCLFPSVYFGRHLGIKQVRYEQTERVRIETEFPLDVFADGEPAGQTPVEFSVARNALKVIAPV